VPHGTTLNPSLSLHCAANPVSPVPSLTHV